MQDIRFSAGETVYCEGDPADAIYVIETGSVEVSRSVDGRSARLGVLGHGEIFGESGVIQDKPRSTTMTALSDLVALKVTKEQFLKAFGEDNPIGLPLLRMLCARLAKADEKLFAIDDTGATDPARVEAIGVIRMQPSSDLIVKQIGAEGIVLKELPFRVGRRIMNDDGPQLTANGLSIHVAHDQLMSPDHFELEKRGGYLIVRDLGSYLGTVVNGAALSRYGQHATKALMFGVNEIIAGTKESPYRFRVIVEQKATVERVKEKAAG